MAFLKITSDAAAGFDGVPEVAADDVAKHTLTITKMVDDATPVGSGADALRVLLDGLGMQVSNDAPVLVGGTVSIEVGPTIFAGSVVAKIVSADGAMKGTIPLRFTRATKDRRFSDLLVRDQKTGDTYKITVSGGALALEKV